MPAFLIPAIALAVGAGASYLKQRAANKSAEEQAKLYNEWLANRQNGVNDLIERLTAGGFDPFGAQTSSSTGTETMDQLTRREESSRPVITPEYAGLEASFRKALEQRLATPTSLPAGYEESAVRAINATAAPGRAAIQNLAARTGRNAEQLSIGSPVERDAAGRTADLMASLPLLERKLRSEDIEAAEGATAQFGRGTESRGTSRTTGTSSRFGTMTTPPNISALANLLLPPSPNASAATGSTLGQVGGDLATALLTLWGMGAFKGGGLWGGGPAGA